MNQGPRYGQTDIDYPLWFYHFPRDNTELSIISAEVAGFSKHDHSKKRKWWEIKIFVASTCYPFVQRNPDCFIERTEPISKEYESQFVNIVEFHDVYVISIELANPFSFIFIARFLLVLNIWSYFNLSENMINVRNF